MSTCPGRKSNGQTHGGTVYRCTHCGAVGCREERCSNYRINGSGRCMACGKYQTYRQI